MIMRLLVLAAFLLALPAAAQRADRATPGFVRVRLETAAGPIVLALNQRRAPITTANFLRYVDDGRFDGVSFYRAARNRKAPQYGFIQSGIRTDARRFLDPIAHEPTSKTGLSNRDGAIAMARGAPGSAQADFFIIMGDLSTLDASPKDPGFAVFGRVVEGMDTVKKILAAPVSATEGVGAMKGQMIAKPVPVTTARRVPK